MLADPPTAGESTNDNQTPLAGEEEEVAQTVAAVPAPKKMKILIRKKKQPISAPVEEDNFSTTSVSLSKPHKESEVVARSLPEIHEEDAEMPGAHQSSLIKAVSVPVENEPSEPINAKVKVQASGLATPISEHKISEPKQASVPISVEQVPVQLNAESN
ncbi:hypothetical protein, partial [Serratia marcescens]|uniref:hypothetical protein n=1 Tax=Serratia marcescens TaxID=615 RepID=UPI00281429D5